jgi:ATP-dependent DNA helicase RecG
MNLKTPVSQIPFVGTMYAKRLERLEIGSVEDLLHHVPARYKDFRTVTGIAKVKPGEVVTIQGNINYIKNIYTSGGKRIQEAEVEDASGKINIIWFNQIYLVKNIKKGQVYSFSGKVDEFNRKKALISPEYEPVLPHKDCIHTARLVPVYPETARVSSKWLRAKIKYVLDVLEDDLDEFLPQSVLDDLKYPKFAKAIHEVHFPDTPEAADLSKQRLAFNEVLFHQLKSMYRKNEWEKGVVTNILKIERKVYKEFTNSLPFALTKSQEKAIKELMEDLGKTHPMNRLLEGDVGSGKTVVAASGAFTAFVNGYQSVFMAPTQILAQQHYLTLRNIFERFKVRVSLITSAGVKSDLGKTDIFVGTHALIHKNIKFDNVAFVVIDEQHRFGVEQRAHLAKRTKTKTTSPHILTMTATPIPRTVALTIYGDLNLSTLTELPKGRVPITTWLVPPQKRNGAYNWIDTQIKNKGIQVFVICPLIEESSIETMKQVKAVTEEYENLKRTFPDMKIGLLHGRQSLKEKNEVLDAFRKGDTNILAATPVVEVGIDVPNANIMVIEGAERFGLAQLHQLRGRVGRGEEKSYCLLFTESRSPKVISRLNALKKSLSGFELAELDLKLRGPGEIYGVKQHGFPGLKIASWQDTEIIKSAKRVAEKAIDKPKKYHSLIKKLRLDSIAPN